MEASNGSRPNARTYIDLFDAETATDHRQDSVKITILEMLGFTAMVGVVAAFWRTGQDRGMVVSIISASSFAYYVNRIRSSSPPFPSTVIALPIVAVTVFVFSLALGLHHPPFMVPPEWKWPPFVSLGTRFVEFKVHSILWSAEL